MADVCGRHLPICCGCVNPRLLTPDKKRDWDHINRKSNNGTENVEVLQAHAIDPRSQDKEDDEGNDVAHENHANQGITNNLSWISSKHV